MSNLPLPLAAFSAGLVSFLSPCVLPLVPGYVSLISGAGLEELKSREDAFQQGNDEFHRLHPRIQHRFHRTGSDATEVGQMLRMYKSFCSQIAGVVIIIFGLHLTGIFKIALLTDNRLHSVKGSSTPFGAFVIGFAFAFGWTPCLGPILAIILTIAGEQDTLVKGVLLLAVYSLGLAVPFLLTSHFDGTVSKVLQPLPFPHAYSGSRVRRAADRAGDFAGDRPLYFDFELAVVLESIRAVEKLEHFRET